MSKRSVLIERKDGRIQSYKISSKSLSKNYYSEKQSPYKKAVYFKKEVNFSKKPKGYQLINKDKRGKFESTKNTDARKMNIDRAIAQVKHTAERTSYKSGYVKADIKVKMKDGEVINVAVVTQLHSKAVMNKMLSSFREEYEDRLKKLEQSPPLEGNIESIKIVRFGFYFKPYGDGK